MTDAALDHALRRTAPVARSARRLPPGYGLAAGATLSLALWAALGGLALALLG